HIGSTFESFLEEQGLKEEVDLLAQKRVIAWQIEQAMAEEKITKADMAARMKTSRTQIDRLLDPRNNKVQLDTLQRAALAVGRSLKVELARTSLTDRRQAAKRTRALPSDKVAARGRPTRAGSRKARGNAG
ncbi:MAG: helix-turn-helix domain-containing protein, partial [Longimicrobiales bacterium]